MSWRARGFSNVVRALFETATDFSFRNTGCGSRAVVSTSAIGFYPAASLVEIGAELDA
jgi:hypothetical protein